MDKRHKIDSIFNILFQYEKIFEEESDVTEETYKNYLDNLYVLFLGYGNDEIAMNIKGLYRLGTSAPHNTVRRNVFHMIGILELEEEVI